jgi:hypothetical protein
VWQDSDVERFNTSNLPRLSRGSTLAWLGHLNALEWLVLPHMRLAPMACIRCMTTTVWRIAC